MKKNLLIAGSVATALLLTGCSNNAALEESISSLTNKVNSLTDQVSMLEADQSSLSSEQSAITSDVEANKMLAEEAANQADRANIRIDSIATSYTK